MDSEKLAELRHFYDNTDTSDLIELAERTDLGVRAGQGTSVFTVSLPTSVLEAARDIARWEGVPTWVILRRFIEEGVGRER